MGFQRDILLVFHTSGVTERPLELVLPVKRTFIKQVQDFDSQEANLFPKENRFSLNAFISSLVKRLIIKAHLVLTEENHSVPKFWTFQLRGHYSSEPIDPILLNSFFELLLGEFGCVIDSDNDVPAIQYRLGDLLHLEGKSPIPVERFEGFVAALPIDQKRLIVLSDSPRIAEELLLRRYPIEVTSHSLSPWITILECSSRQHFLGTNSKISIWAAIIRANQSPELQTWMPYELEQTLQKMLGLERFGKSIILY
jgi:hypothetical protein